MLLKVTFNIPYGAGLAASTPQGLCVPLPGDSQPKAGEEWLVDIAHKKPGRPLCVKLVRRWRGLLADYQAIQKGQPDFRNGLLHFKGRVHAAFPLEETEYAAAWRDYQALLENTNAVIIRNGLAIRWRKKGKPPVEMTLEQFATKYKRQPLLGVRQEIEDFLNSLDLLVAQAVERSKKKRAGAVPEKDPVVEVGKAAASSLHDIGLT